MWTIAADNHQGKAFAALLVLFLIIAATLCGLRILSRRLHRHALDASDYMCFLALVLDIGLTVIIWGSFAHGYGQDITEFSLNDAKFASKLFIAIEVVWAAAAVSVRISIILLCICLFPVRLFRLVSWMVVGLNLATFLSTVLTACLICRPIFYSFDKTIPGGHCGDLMAFEDFQAIMSLLLDLTIVVLPLPLLWQLQMKRQKKIQLSVVFGTGLM